MGMVTWRTLEASFWVFIAVSLWCAVRTRQLWRTQAREAKTRSTRWRAWLILAGPVVLLSAYGVAEGAVVPVLRTVLWPVARWLTGWPQWVVADALDSAEQMVAVGATTGLAVAGTGLVLARRRHLGVAEGYCLANPVTSLCAYGSALLLDSWLAQGAHGSQHTFWYACAYWGSAPVFGLVVFAAPMYALVFDARGRSCRWRGGRTTR
jgi:hypothetical protein